MRLIFSAFAACLILGEAHAVNPANIQRGQQLFTQPFSPVPLSPSGDGLGPLFNHVSCVACHHSGGVGGAGDHRFNARSLSIGELRFMPASTRETLNQAIGDFTPLLLGSRGEVTNSVALPRHGGSHQSYLLRSELISSFNADWDDDGKVNSDSVRAERIGRTINNSSGSLTVRTHIFARNTTSLFGAGLIDRVPDAAIVQQAKTQKRFPEIQGRPATLADGRIGKFGWRANFASLVEFTENACANELGLQTRRAPQPVDVTQPQYSNPAVDIDDASIIAMTHFIASLPEPTHAAPVDSTHQQQLLLGEQRFSAVGCADCHVPVLGPAKGIYSDLLLHDMGPTSLDYNSAPPYLKSSSLDYEEVAFRRVGHVGHYGTPVSIAAIESNGVDRVLQVGPEGEFVFNSPEQPPRSVTIPLNLGRPDDQMEIAGPATFRGRTIPAGTPLLSGRLRLQRVVRSETIPTNITREWRTPPLWGVCDSAPYLHDGRAETLLEAIAMHDGEAARTRDRYFELSYDEQLAVIAFLESLVAPTQGAIPAPKDFTRRQTD